MFRSARLHPLEEEPTPASTTETCQISSEAMFKAFTHALGGTITTELGIRRCSNAYRSTPSCHSTLCSAPGGTGYCQDDSIAPK